MRPTKSQALQMLEDAKLNPDFSGVARHCLCVGNTAGKIAKALNQAGQNLDTERVYCLGYLHDYGKTQDFSVTHTTSGYYLLKNLGFDDDFCTICLIHHHINNDPNCVTCTLPDPKTEKFLIDTVAHHHFTLEEKLIGFCDSICLYYPTTIEKRLVDCLSRHGTCSGTQSRIQALFELKSEIDTLLGYDLYELFPTVKDKILDPCWDDPD